MNITVLLRFLVHSCLQVNIRLYLNIGALELTVIYNAGTPAFAIIFTLLFHYFHNAFLGATAQLYVTGSVSHPTELIHTKQ